MVGVTGSPRSGTSCVTGLLSRYGFSLGTAYPVLTESTEFNVDGHYEVGLVLVINDLVIHDAGGKWFELPLPSRELIDRAGIEDERYFRLFARKFDGNLFKDPRLCVTWTCWERFCPNLDHAVFCLRHPSGAARSMQKRYRFSSTKALEFWTEYTRRFFDGSRRSRVTVIDYDALCLDPTPTLTRLLDSLGHPSDQRKIDAAIDGFLQRDLNHTPLTKDSLSALPEETRSLYLKVRDMAREPMGH